MTILQKVLGNMERQENLSQPNPAMWPRLRDEETTCWASSSFFSVKEEERKWIIFAIPLHLLHFHYVTKAVLFLRHFTYGMRLFSKSIDSYDDRNQWQKRAEVGKQRTSSDLR